MLNNEKLGNTDIGIDFCGYHLQSPFIMSSGPLCYGADGMIKGHNYGAGAVVTKTIRLGEAINPVHHMGNINKDSLINCEKWADTDRFNWYENEIPRTVESGAIVIASVGHTPREAMEIVKDVEKAGAHMIELVSYTEDTLLPMLDYTKKHVQIPVICKLSGNWPDPVGTAAKCLEHGADGLCAIDSIGPVLKIDINNASPEMQSDNGYGWLTGAAMRPISMRYNYEIARNHKDFMNLYASGGIMSPDDAIEYIMAGAMGVGFCSAGILNGVEYLEKMCYGLAKKLHTLGYNSINEVNRAAHKNFPQKEIISKLDFKFEAFKEDGSKKCISCRKCEKVCCYDARKLDFPNMTVDMNKCRSCGLCLDICPTNAITATIMEQTEEDIKRENFSKNFNNIIK